MLPTQVFCNWKIRNIYTATNLTNSVIELCGPKAQTQTLRSPLLSLGIGWLALGRAVSSGLSKSSGSQCIINAENKKAYLIQIAREQFPYCDFSY